MGLNFIKLPLSFAALFEKLTTAQIGFLVCSMFNFCKTGEEPDFEPTDPLYFLWPMCRDCVVESQEAYERRCSVNRENGKKGGRPPKQTQDDFPV